MQTYRTQSRYELEHAKGTYDDAEGEDIETAVEGLLKNRNGEVMYTKKYDRGKKVLQKRLSPYGGTIHSMLMILKIVIYDVAEDIDGKEISDDYYETLAIDLLDRELMPQLKAHRGKGTEKLKQYICKELGQTETRYIDRERQRGRKDNTGV